MLMHRSLKGIALLLGLGVLIGGLANPAAATREEEFGAYIYGGTCNELDERPLEEVGDVSPDDRIRDNSVLGTPVPNDAFGEDEESDIPLETLLATPHAIVIRSSDEITGDIVACGEIQGMADTSGTLAIDLVAAEGSAFEGRAWLAPTTDDDDPTSVMVVVWTAGAGVATPGAATPAA